MGKRRKRHRQRQRKRKRQRQRNRTSADKISRRRKFRIWRMEGQDRTGLVRMEELGKFLGREILRHQMERMEEALKNTKQRNNKQQKHNKLQPGTFT